MVYLIHFDRPIGDIGNPRGQAQHYIGCTDNLARRLREHRNGYGARIMQAVAKRGIEWKVSRTWVGGWKVERKLKDQHNAPRLCPICRKPR